MVSPKTAGSCCFITSIMGSLTLLVFGLLLRSHYPFLGFEGDENAAASSCFWASFIFLITSMLSLVSYGVGMFQERYARRRRAYLPV
ncbi:hypothetical protein GpartN1_g5366.t1 [Galdieria partita]|uniref:Uncharacterized protein n=1 Tax=Galdieria partita TaxID=83374 RepID=A0A9C7Q002_9RHOD|nr:hypothetical protein GpartN1_g5366.t1 [Galdieria partita]